MKLLIKKFKSLENLELNIPAKISGGNGKGKSTILEAISFVLTGKDLSGNEFKQVYDNRVDLHDAIADVSYFDNYGNEFQRIVKPIFQTNRAGIEEIKIKRSTECRKNGIPVNDFSDEFVDFYKFGTDYFFNQKEDLQRSIFIDLLKSKLPEYDVNSASLKLKELKKSQKIEVDLVKSLNDANKNTKDVQVPEIPSDIEKLNAEFLTLSTASNPELVGEINKRNNDLMMSHFNKKMDIQNNISRCNIEIERIKKSIESETEKLESIKTAKFEPKALHNVESLQQICEKIEIELSHLEYFESLEAYAQKYFGKNPVFTENAEKIKEISERVFVKPDISGSESKCPINGQKCEVAESDTLRCYELEFKGKNDREIYELKTQNRSILEKEMNAVNSKYLSVKSDFERETSLLNKLIDANKSIESDNALKEMNFDMQTNEEISIINKNVIDFEEKLKALIVDLSRKQVDLTNLVEPTPEKLPESVEISEELITLNNEYIAVNEQIIGAKAINENNAKLIAERSKEIKIKQANLLDIIGKITTLTSEISDYFNNLKGIVKSEFAGEIEIDVELLEYVMSKDEYKDCFKITANGKVFPYECNGALQNNVKLQILANMQRLKGYKGMTVMDNCEANTTQPINTCGLNCVLAYVTLENELIIK